MVDSIVKHPNEKLTCDFDYTGRLRSGVTLSSASFTAKNLTLDQTATSDILDTGTGSTSGNKAFFILKAGEAKNLYRVVCEATLSNGNKLRDYILVNVLDDI